MATRRKKTSGTALLSTSTDLQEELNAIFTRYPEGAAIAYGFLTTEANSPYIDITDRDNIWRVRREVVDRFIDGVSDRVELQWTKKI